MSDAATVAGIRALTARLRERAGEAERDAERLRKFNPYHKPAGTPEGGQFDFAPGNGGGEGGSLLGSLFDTLFGIGTAFADEIVQTVLDVKAAIEHLLDNAHSSTQHQCAHYVKEAINAGGVPLQAPLPKIPGGDSLAKDFGPQLEKVGFYPVLRGVQPANPPSLTMLKNGDVAVIQSTMTSPAGHMAMYTGKQWVSDFKQRDFWPGPRYRAERPSYVIYRIPHRK